MTSQIPKVFTHCHPPLILHTHFAQAPPPRPDSQCIPQKLCIVNYSGRPPPSPCYERPLRKIIRSADLQHTCAVSALQVYGRPDIVIQRHGCSVLGKRLHATVACVEEQTG